MYDKNQIIEEIKRVAALLDTRALKKKDFIKNTMIPLSTINFYISSWEEALTEAGLEDGSHDIEIKDEDLLKDLIQVREECGENPTFALIEKYGKFSKEDYQKKWRSLEDAFSIAKAKYGKKMNGTPDQTVARVEETDEPVSPDKTITASGKGPGKLWSESDMEKTLVSVRKEDIDTGEGRAFIPDEMSDHFSSDNVLTLDKMKDPGNDQKKRDDESEPVIDYLSEEDGIENLMAMDIKKPEKKKIIPETIKPETDKRSKGKGESFCFRGIKFAPVDTRGVIYIFGLVSEELNFVIESLGSENFCFSGRRNVSAEDEQWIPVNIGFALDSMDMKGSVRLTKNCDLLVCWKHNWDECPVEVLELSSTLKLLDNN